MDHETCLLLRFVLDQLPGHPYSQKAPLFVWHAVLFIVSVISCYYCFVALDS